MERSSWAANFGLKYLGHGLRVDEVDAVAAAVEVADSEEAAEDMEVVVAVAVEDTVAAAQIIVVVAVVEEAVGSGEAEMVEAARGMTITDPVAEAEVVVVDVVVTRPEVEAGTEAVRP